MTQLTATTPLPIVWFWMFLAGLGVGPTFSVFTIIVQNAVPFHELGVATSNLTFFRQIGGTVALAIVGTIFGQSFQDQLAPQLTAAGVPPQVVAGFGQASASGTLDFNKLTGVGDLGQQILAAIPAQFQAVVAPFISNIVTGIHAAFSLAVAQTFWIGVAAAADRRGRRSHHARARVEVDERGAAGAAGNRQRAGRRCTGRGRPRPGLTDPGDGLQFASSSRDRPRRGRRVRGRSVSGRVRWH